MEIDPRYMPAFVMFQITGFYFLIILMLIGICLILIGLCPGFWERHFFTSMAVFGAIFLLALRNAAYFLCAALTTVLVYMDIRMSIKKEFEMKLVEIDKEFPERFGIPKI